mgnify:CR=1 FL=1
MDTNFIMNTFKDIKKNFYEPWEKKIVLTTDDFINYFKSDTIEHNEDLILEISDFLIEDLDWPGVKGSDDIIVEDDLYLVEGHDIAIENEHLVRWKYKENDKFYFHIIAALDKSITFNCYSPELSGFIAQMKFFDPITHDNRDIQYRVKNDWLNKTEVQSSKALELHQNLIQLGWEDFPTIKI